MDYRLSEEQQLIVDTTRRFVESEIVPLEDELDPDAGSLLPADYDRLLGKTQSMGFYGLDIPEEYGGPGLDTTTRALMAIEMSQHRAGLYNPCYGVFGGAGLAQLYEATEEQKERWLYPHSPRRKERLLRPHRAIGRFGSRSSYSDARLQRRRGMGSFWRQAIYIRSR